MPASSPIGRIGAGNLRASPGRRIGLAAGTGAVAKGLAVVAQVLAVAIAVRALGAAGFALYVVISSLVTWISIAGLGVAPGLTIGVARAAAVGDRVTEARLFIVAVLLMAAVAATLTGIAVILVASGVLGRVLSEWMGPTAGDASAAVLCITLLLAVQLMVMVPEAARLGLQNQDANNVWSAVGAAAAIVAMVVFGRAVSSVAAFVLISQGPQLAARAVNGIVLVLNRPHLMRPEGVQFRQYARPILGSGVAFAGLSLASYLGLQVGLLVMAATVDPASVALAGVIVRAYTLEIGGLSLVTTPTWPAITSAVTRGDMPWVRRAYRLLVSGAVAYSGVYAIAIIVALEAILEIWTGSRPVDNAGLRLLLATFVVVNAWGHVNAMTLVGLGALRFTAIVLTAEAVLVLGLQVALVPSAGVTGYVGALAVGSIAVSGWLLPLRVRRAIHARI